MKLYKNVDLQDLKSILTKGILSLDDSNNPNWNNGNRADNPTDVVYLFKATTDFNTFPKSYGIALVEVEVDAALTTMVQNDQHSTDYDEYTIASVNANQITNVFVPNLFANEIEQDEMVFVPNLFANEIEQDEMVFEKVTFCEMTADFYSRDLQGNCTLVNAPQEVLSQFASTTNINTDEFNYFRGKNSDGTMIELENVKYLIK